MVQVTNFTSEQAVPFHVLFRQYWDEVELEKPIDLIRFEGADGPDITNQLQAKLYTYEREGAKIRLAYHERELIGFLIYHMIFNCIMICRAVYIKPEFRKLSVSRRLFFHDKKVKRVYAQTYGQKEPVVTGLSAEKEGRKRRRVVHEEDGMKIWEIDVVGAFDGDTGNKEQSSELT